MTGDEASRDQTYELERLADQLSLRDIKTILGPGPDGEYCLEVINLRPAGAQPAPRTGKIWWRNGSFWWSGIEEMPGSGDLARAMEFVLTALRWSRDALSPPVSGSIPAG